MKVHLDTHVAIWLAAGDKRRLRSVTARLSRSALFVSPVTLLEMEFLHEIGRIRSPVNDVWEILAHALADSAILLTADETIRAHCSQARWT